MRSEDIVRVRHMLDAAREALAFVANKTRSEMGDDRMLSLAPMKSIEIIGEAASKLSRECRSEYPAIPWADVVGMRNRLIHAYADVDPDILWETVIADLPALIPILEDILETSKGLM